MCGKPTKPTTSDTPLCETCRNDWNNDVKKREDQKCEE